jgi:hypothetical protein
MDNIGGRWDSGIQGETNPMPVPQSLEQCFTLLGCISAAYIAARLITKILYRIVCWIIAKWGDDDKQIDSES